MQQEIDYLRMLADNGGPTESQYEELGILYKSLNQRRKKGIITEAEVMNVWQSLPDVYITKDTMQGYALLKPHGYSGDYVIIERIYQKWLSPKEHLMNWDRFFHSQEAPCAIINRKEYFLDILDSLQKIDGQRDVLNIGCGPSNDVIDFLSKGESHIFFDCVDYDKDAIEYSHNKVKEKGFLNHIEFHRENAFKFRPSKQYDLIWSAGLFDYLDEKTFKMLLSKQLAFLKTGGELVLGNFSLKNPTRDYMECGNWFLYHRSPDDLMKIAEECGIPEDKISVKSESLGVNLFLHISR